MGKRVVDDASLTTVADEIRAVAVSYRNELQEMRFPDGFVYGVNRVYDMGYEDGEFVGFADGRRQGEIEGMAVGKAAGLAEGETIGYEKGHTAGLTEGVEQGKQAEYDAFWDDFQQNGERKTYAYAFGGNGWTTKNFRPKYPIILSGTTVCDYMFNHFARYKADTGELFDFTEFNNIIDFSGCTRANYTFQNARIKNLYCDLSNCTTLLNTFDMNNGGAVDYLTLKVSEKTTAYTSTFRYNDELKEIRFTDDSVIAVNISFQWSNLLTTESAKSVIKVLKNFVGTDKEFTYTVRFHADVWAKLDAEGNAAPDGSTWRDYVGYALGWNI